MRDRAEQQEDGNASEFGESAVGFDPDVQLPDFLRELFLGDPEETTTERLARISAAQGILSDLRAEAPDLAAYIAARYDIPGGGEGE
jgi:hypothetical protein